MLAIGLDDKLPNFRVDLDRLTDAVDLVLETTREAYPSLDVPFHSRWRHFVIDGDDRWAAIGQATRMARSAARARAEFDLAIVSVLLDAGAGPHMALSRSRKRRTAIGRSEGLALASLAMFAGGAFSADPDNAACAPMRASWRICRTEPFAADCRSPPANPLVGLEGRADLLRRLGALVASKPEIFARHDTPRPGGLFDHLAAAGEGRTIPAPIDPVRTAAAARPDLAVAADARRHRARRLLAASLADDGRRHQRPGAAAQAVAVAGLFADRAAATGRHRGHRHRRSDRPRRISQRRTVRRYRRADVSRLRPTPHASTSGFTAGGRMARADGGAARPARRGRAAAARTGCDALPLAKVLEGGTWAAGRAWRASAAPTARRRSRSSATARCSEDSSGGSHGRRHGRRPSAGAAQADADPRQRHLDQIVSRTAQGDRDAAVLRGHARPAAHRGRNRNAAGAHEVAADRRQEAGVRADPARRRDVRRRHARSGAGRARRPYRALSRAGNLRRRRILLQGAERSCTSGW